MILAYSASHFGRQWRGGLLIMLVVLLFDFHKTIIKCGTTEFNIAKFKHKLIFNIQLTRKHGSLMFIPVCTSLLGIVLEPFLVLFRPGTTSVWSGLGTFSVLELEHSIRPTKSWCVAHGGRWGVVRERERTADECRSVPNTGHLTTGCLKQSQLPPPNRPGIGRRTVHPPYC